MKLTVATSTQMNIDRDSGRR